MRIFSILLFFVSFSMTSAYSQDAKQGEHADPEPKTFQEAYAGYNEAVKATDGHLTTHYAQRGYELGLEKFGAEHKNTLNLALNWVKAYSYHSKDHNSPEPLLKKILPYFEKSTETAPATLIEINLTFGTYFLKDRDYQNHRKAKSYFGKAIKIAEQHYTNEDNTVALVNMEIGKALYTNQETQQAKKHILKAQQLFNINAKKNTANLAIANFWLAKSYLTAKNHDKAAQAMSQALITFDEIAPTSHYTLTGHAFMIQILEKQGKRDEATKHCQIIGKAKPIDVNREQLPLYRFAPKYPRSAAQSRREGDVIIEFTVDEEGFVKNPKAIDGKNMQAFAPSAIKAVKDYRFAPRYENGKPVSTDGLKTRFTFQMAW